MAGGSERRLGNFRNNANMEETNAGIIFLKAFLYMHCCFIIVILIHHHTTICEMNLDGL